MKNPCKFIHYSKKKKITLRDDFYEKYRLHYFGSCADMHKPIGFWFSVEDDEPYGWKEWCEAENFRIDCLKHKFEVKLKENSNIIYLNSVDDICEFSLKYGIHEIFSYNILDNKGSRTPFIYKIKWNKVMQLYDGIVISPYQWDCRLHRGTSWYYSWDCSSGCIWNLSCIESLTLIENEKKNQQVKKLIQV